jgi:hypothetical protein
MALETLNARRGKSMGILDNVKEQLKDVNAKWQGWHVRSPAEGKNAIDNSIRYLKGRYR